MQTPPLERDGLMAAASAAAGLDDYGDLYFVEALDQLIASLEKDARINEAGRKTRALQYTNILINRLRAEDHFKRFPEILEQDIAVDAVIVGLPRTGSTMLHRLLAADPGNTAMKMWEGFNPSPFPGEERGNPEKRHKAGERSAAHINASSPGFDAIHEVDPYAAEEEILLLEHTFMSSVAESAFYVPSYGEWLMATDQTPAYEDLKRFLKFLQWQDPARAGKRWVLKTPQHVPLVDVVLKVFPGAKIIMTHRDPVQTVPSFCSMVSSYSMPWTEARDEKAIGAYWNHRLKWNLEQFMEKRSVIGEEPFIDADYRDTLKDPIGTARKVYDHLGRGLDPSSEQVMRDWSEENQKDKHGKHAYTAEQFGLSDDGIAQDFAFYRDRFIL